MQADAENLTSFKYKLPIKLNFAGDVREVTWVDAQGLAFTEPFFEETIKRVKAEEPQRREFITGIEPLLRFANARHSLKPSGFIFHASRCGSTVVANALRQIEGSLVVAEPALLNTVLRLCFLEGARSPEYHAFRQLLLQSAFSALGQPFKGNERRFFIKFSHWNFNSIALLRKLFPAVPALFLFRHPVEIMVSNLTTQGSLLKLPSSPDDSVILTGASLEEVERMGQEEFMARSLGRLFSLAATHADNLNLLDYSDLSLAKLLDIIRYFGIPNAEIPVDALQRTLSLYSKDSSGTRSFVGDAAAKRAIASPLTHEMAEQWAMPAYERLRQLAVAG